MISTSNISLLDSLAQSPLLLTVLCAGAALWVLVGLFVLWGWVKF